MLLAILHMYTQSTLRANISALETLETRRNVDVALNALRESVAHLDTTCADWAIWDDTYSFVEDLNDDYIQSNLTRSTFTNLKINLMLFVNPAGKVVFGKSFDLRTGTELPVLRMAEHLSTEGPLLRHRSTDSRLGGFLLLPEGPMVVASRPILNSQSEGPIRGALIMGFFLDTPAVERLAGSVRLPVSILSLDDPGLPGDLRAAGGSTSGTKGIHVQYAGTEDARGYAIVEDIYGAPCFVVRVDLPRAIYNQARENLWRLEAFAILVSLFLGALIVLAMEKMVLSPLARLVSGVNRVRTTGDLSARLAVRGEDDLSNLGREINRMLEAVEISQRGLRESEARLRRINDNMLDLLCQVDENGIVQYASASHLTVLGHSPEEITGTAVLDLAHPDDRGCLSAAMQEIAGAGLPQRVEFRCRHAGGHYVWLESVSSPLLDDGGLSGTIIASRDITERKRTEKELKHRLALEEAVAQVAAILVSADTGDLNAVLAVLGRVVDADRAYVFQFRESRERLDKTFEWLAPGVEPQVDSIQWTESPRIPWWIGRLLNNETIIVSDTANLPDEAAGQRKVLEAQGVRSVLEVPIFCAGELLGLLGFDHMRGPREWSDEDAQLLRTVSEILAAHIQRKHGENALRESEERYRMLVENQDEGIGIFDLEERFTFANPAAHEIFGLDHGRLVGRSLREFIDSESLQTLLKNVELRQLGLKTTYEIEITRPGGEKRVLILTGAPRFDSHKKLIGTFGIFRDITERKRAEEQVKYLSYHDRLTGLYNRAYLEDELARPSRERRLPISIIMGDVNGLKLINDALGHHEGDRYLVEMARILRSSCRKDDVVARWGGDEFVIVLPKTTQKGAMEVCERIRQACLESHSDPVQLSIALGAVTKEQPGDDIWKLFKEAEDRMYRNKLLENKSTRSFIILSLQKTLREKSHETEEHAKRLLKTALDIGRAVGLSDSKLDELALLAALHDIGKIAIPDNILLKPATLSKEEWEIVKKHPEIGYRIATSSPEMAPIAEAILSHHERWDGTGYPQGFRGEEIPLISRIIAVADAYDTMTHGRRYKEPVSHEAALKEISAGAGSQFDPDVVQAFLKIFSQNG